MSEYIVDMFSDVVDNVRETGIVDSFTESSGTYTIVSDNTLLENWHVSINSVNYKISNVSSTGFTITGETGIDFTLANWKALEPYYDYGHITDILQKLTIKDGNNDYKFQKYPLIALLLDISESHGEDTNYKYSFSPLILILAKTDKNYTSQERYTNIFKNTLYPIYERLMQEIKLYRKFDFRYKVLIPHTKTDRVYWGSIGAFGNVGIQFNDYLDGIELKIDNINVEDIPATCQ